MRTDDLREPDRSLALTREQAAGCLGVDLGFLDRHVVPELRTTEVSGELLIPPAELRRWMLAPVDDRLLTLAEAAAEVQKSPRTVLRAIRAGELVASQLNQHRGGWCIYRSEIHAWLARRATSRRQPDSPPDARRIHIGKRAASVRHKEHHGDEGRLEP